MEGHESAHTRGNTIGGASVTNVAMLAMALLLRGQQLSLGEPATPVPAPVADLIDRHIATRTNMGTATNPGSRWLLPGRRAGQPLRPDYLSELLQQLGVPTSAGRGAALRQHLLEVPARVIADALGYHYTTTTRLAG